MGKDNIIGENVYLGKNITMHKPLIIRGDSFIEDNVVLGFPYSGEIDKFMEKYRKNNGLSLDEFINKLTIIGEKCTIRSGSKIAAGAKIGNNVYINFDCFVGTDTEVGDNVIIKYRSQIYDEVVIGKNSLIAGFVGDRCKIGKNVAMMGKLIHKYNFKPERRPVLSETEISPIIEDYVFVGMDALIIGEVTVKEGAYVAAGAVVTKDVDPYDIVAGVPAKSIKDKVKLI